ncbi:hypothetical protein IQ06DRAFT_355946 [Phaeosphaeriaceae sp. SRC1lsM3a]|nr:hypothetical protein IQ06DRAFT_355946 [Stagonospora sp. SRC1lsM3a]
MALTEDGNASPSVPDTEIKAEKRRVQRAKYRQRKAARKAAERNGEQDHVQPTHDSIGDSTGNPCPSDMSVPNAKLHHVSQVKSTSAASHATPAHREGTTDVEETQACVHKKTQRVKTRVQDGGEQAIRSTLSEAPSLSSSSSETLTPVQQKNASEVDSAPTQNVVVDQPLDNLYIMIREQREKLFHGPLITIHIGEHHVTGIYKRVAMATSSVLHNYFDNNPDSVDFTVQDSVAPEAVKYMLNTWMQEMCHEFEVHAMPLQSSFTNNVAILRAARFLGMEPYTKWILTNFVEYLRDNIPSYEEVAIVGSNRTSKSDPLWTLMVNHLTHVRHRGQLPDPEIFTAFLE